MEYDQVLPLLQSTKLTLAERRGFFWIQRFRISVRLHKWIFLPRVTCLKNSLDSSAKYWLWNIHSEIAVILFLPRFLLLSLCLWCILRLEQRMLKIRWKTRKLQRNVSFLKSTVKITVYYVKQSLIANW